MAVTSLTASLAGRQIAAGVAAAGGEGGGRGAGVPAGAPAGASAARRATPSTDGGGRSYADIWAAATVAGATARPLRPPARGRGGGGGGDDGTRGGGDGGGDARRGDGWTVARAYGVPTADVEAHIVGPLPPDLYIVGRILLLDRVAGPAGGGPTPAVASSLVSPTAPELRDVPVSEWMLADHATAALGRALASLYPAAADGAGGL